MALRLTEKSDIRIFILYLLMQVDSRIDFVTLHDIAVQDEFVNPFDFMEEFYELQKIKALELCKDSRGEEFVRITLKGRDIAETMKDNISPEILNHALRSALQLISFKTKNLTASSYVDAVKDGKYSFVCKVEGPDGVYMETRLLLDSRKKAEKMKINYDERSEFIYRGIMALFSGNVNYLAESWSDDLAASGEDADK